MEKQLTRIKAFVNAIYNNEKTVKVSLSEKKEDGSYVKYGATIWKTKVNGQETVAFKQLKEIKEAKKLGSLDAEVEMQGDYKGVQQVVIRNILGHYILTDEQYEAKLKRIEEFSNKPKPFYFQEAAPVAQAKPVEQATNSVPWDLDL